MKYLFFLVLFANIVFFLWQITNGTSEFDTPAQYDKNPSPHQILLVNETRLRSLSDPLAADQSIEKHSETKETQQAADIVEKENQLLDRKNTAENSAITNSYCYEIGPFADDKIQKKWLDDARAKSDSIEIVHKPMEIQHGFVIFIPPQETFEKSKAYYEMLRRQGITDLWLFKKGRSRGMISLGIYRNKQSGEKIQRQYSAQGMDARIKPYFKTEQRYVVRFRSKEEIIQDLEILLGTWRRVLPVLEINEISFCEETEDDSSSLPEVVKGNTA